MQGPLYKIIFADVINPISDNEAVLMRDAALVLKRSTISNLKGNSEYTVFALGKRAKIEKEFSTKKSIEITNLQNQMILPTFIDMHFHWVQDDVSDMQKENLLDWLKNYAWPYEA